MWPLVVAVRDERAQGLVEVATAEDEQPVETFGSAVRTNRSVWAFAFSVRTGVWMTVIPLLRGISSKTAADLRSRSWIKNRVRSNRPLKLRLRARCASQAPVGLDDAPF